jgi:hypothetical protein
LAITSDHGPASSAEAMRRPCSSDKGIEFDFCRLK